MRQISKCTAFTATCYVQNKSHCRGSGFVLVNLTTLAPCFTAGTLITTATGPQPIETLHPGDLVLTRDHGAQPVRWIGSSTRRALGPDAPVVFSAGALGTHNRIELSLNHRVLIGSSRAELLFGEAEVLVKAKDLINGDTIALRNDGGLVTFVHLLFDSHEIICANGMFSESYHPGTQTLRSFDIETRQELFRLFPELETVGPSVYGPTARRVVRSYESRILLAN